MAIVLEELLEHFLNRLRQVQHALGQEQVADGDFDTLLGEQLDSMGLVEFTALLADDCGVAAEAIENSVGKQFGTVRELAAALIDKGRDELHGRIDFAAALRGPAATYSHFLPAGRWM